MRHATTAPRRPPVRTLSQNRGRIDKRPRALRREHREDNVVESVGHPNLRLVQAMFASLQNSEYSRSILGRVLSC